MSIYAKKRAFFSLYYIFFLHAFLPTEDFHSSLDETFSVQEAPIYIVYHVATLNNWEEIAEEQLSLLETSGLLHVVNQLFVSFVGVQKEAIESLFLKSYYSNKITLIHSSSDLSVCEFPSLAKVKQIANECPEAKILYLHSKGVLHIGKSTEMAVKYWRRYMEYFLIQKWQACLEELNASDACGVEWRKRPPHFSGNFWWARADYLNTIPTLGEPYLFRKRLDCELRFIGRGKNPKIKELHNSSFSNLYRTVYYPENYVEK